MVCHAYVRVNYVIGKRNTIGPINMSLVNLCIAFLIVVHPLRAGDTSNTDQKSFFN